MKLYSNIHNQAQINIAEKIDRPNSKKVTFEESNNVLNFPMQSAGISSNLGADKKLQLGLTALNLYMLPSHISVVDEEQTNKPFHQVPGSATRSTTPRKKIFNEENILYKIMEPISEQIKQEVKIIPPKNNNQMYEPQPPKDLTSYIRPQQKTKTLQTSSQFLQKKVDKSIRKINRNFQTQTKYERQQAYRILAQPILQEERSLKPSLMTQSIRPLTNKNQIQAKIPEMIQRIDRNQKAILQLKAQVNELIKIQNQKNLSFRKQLSYRQRLIQQKQSNLQNQIRQIQNQEYQFQLQKNSRNQLQKQQQKRIQELIEENKMLSHKILEQRANTRKLERKQDSQYLRNRIAQLQRQREAIQKDRIKNLRNLDISIIPHRQQQFPSRVQVLVPTNQPPPPNSARYPLLNSPKNINQPTIVLPDNLYNQVRIREIKVTKMY